MCVGKKRYCYCTAAASKPLCVMLARGTDARPTDCSAEYIQSALNVDVFFFITLFIRHFVRVSPRYATSHATFQRPRLFFHCDTPRLEGIPYRIKSVGSEQGYDRSSALDFFSRTERVANTKQQYRTRCVRKDSV